MKNCVRIASIAINIEANAQTIHWCANRADYIGDHPARNEEHKQLEDRIRGQVMFVESYLKELKALLTKENV